MPLVNGQGTDIYYEVEGSGETVVLQHGFSDSLETWREYGYVDALAASYQVVTIDARGHGSSGKPHDPALYDTKILVSDVTAVLDALEVKACHFFGVSMGGRYGFGMARYAADRLLSLMIGAVSPYQNPERGRAFVSFLQQGPESFIPVWESQAPISDALKDRLRANDNEALIAMQRGARLDEYSEEDAVDWLLSLTCPFQLIAGDQDELAPYSEVVRYAKNIPAERLISLPGINHLESMQRIDLVLPHLRSLFTSVG